MNIELNWITKKNTILKFCLKLIGPLFLLGLIIALYIFDIEYSFFRYWAFLVLFIVVIIPWIPSYHKNGKIVFSEQAIFLDDRSVDWSLIQSIEIGFSRPMSNTDYVLLFFRFNEYGVGSYFKMEMKNQSSEVIDFFLTDEEERELLIALCQRNRNTFGFDFEIKKSIL